MSDAPASTDNSREQLKLLFDYTKFHIGFYITLATAIIGADILKLGGGVPAGHFHCAVIAVVSLLIAGFCGGVIAANIPYHLDKAFEKFTGTRETLLGPWELKLLPYYAWAWLEHYAFWVAVLTPITAFVVKKPIGCWFVLVIAFVGLGIASIQYATAHPRGD